MRTQRRRHAQWTVSLGCAVFGGGYTTGVAASETHAFLGWVGGLGNARWREIPREIGTWWFWGSAFWVSLLRSVVYKMQIHLLSKVSPTPTQGHAQAHWY